MTEPLVDALLAAPVGVCLLAALEGLEHDDLRWWDHPKQVDAAAVGRAAASMATAAFGDVVALAVERGERDAGAWMSDAPANVASAYRGAEGRRPIAEALVARFGHQLEQPIDLAGQEWWTSPPSENPRWAPCFLDLSTGYDGGEFPWGGLRTTTRPPEAAHDPMVGAWEIYPEPVSRWHLPVVGTPRIWEIHRPDDWGRLVEAFPRSADPHGSWSLPGPNQRTHEVREVVAASGQRAARTEVAGHRVPDWPAVAGEYDAVHLSWAGYLTSEGFVSDLPGGGVAMLRYWFAERALWLRDVFGEPAPMGAPVLQGGRGTDARRDPVRLQADRDVLRILLGR